MKNVIDLFEKNVWLGMGCIVLFQILMHSTHFSADLNGVHVWRQTETQATIDCFYAEDFNILNPRTLNRGDGDGIQRREFPVLQWSIAGLYKLFGNHLIITRLSMFAITMLAMMGIFFLVRKLLDGFWPALVSAWAFSLSPSIFYHGINPMPDIAALCAVIWAIYFVVTWVETNRMLHIVLSALFFGLATAIKLPYVMLYLIPLVCIIQNVLKGEYKSVSRVFMQGMFFVLFLMPAAIWYIKVIPGWGKQGIVSGILSPNVNSSELLSFAVHNMISTLPELLLNYGAVILFGVGLFQIFFSGGQRHKLFLPLLAGGLGVLAYYLFELNMIGTDHDYYAYPFTPILFIAIGCGARFLLTGSKTSKAILLVSVVSLPFFTLARKGHAWNQDEVLITYKSELQNAVPNDALCIVGNDLSPYVYLYHLQKKGWVFQHDQLTSEQLRVLKKKGAQYLYSNSSAVNHMVEDELKLRPIAVIATFTIYKI